MDILEGFAPNLKELEIPRYRFAQKEFAGERFRHCPMQGGLSFNSDLARQRRRASTRTSLNLFSFPDYQIFNGHMSEWFKYINTLSLQTLEIKTAIQMDIMYGFARIGRFPALKKLELGGLYS